MGPDQYDNDPMREEREWIISNRARALMVAHLARLEVDANLATEFAEYRLARIFMWERERMRLILHPPTVATAARPRRIR